MDQQDNDQDDAVDAEGDEGVRLDEAKQELDAQQGDDKGGNETGNQEIDLRKRVISGADFIRS